jgi:hypothetical protein
MYLFSANKGSKAAIAGWSPNLPSKSIRDLNLVPFAADINKSGLAD